jgi:hypothetical protein
MTTERAAALTDTARAGGEADADLNPSDRPEADQPCAKARRRSDASGRDAAQPKRQCRDTAALRG